MADKMNILAGLGMPPRSQDSNNKENQHQQPANSPRPGSGGVIRQHKLKQRFTVIRKLGKGTYGKVQLAVNKETNQEVAIKTIKKSKIENDQDLQRVRREIQIMSSIEHPHIIHIYEVFENKDKIVLVMQYAPGGELYEYVSQSKLLDDTEARRLFRQIATAIYYCHQNKICHRDLKLENILLDEKNNAKLADFGLSNVFDKRRQLKTFCGSPLYASPEIVQGLPYEGPEVDCWSLGVLLYTLVYGAMPFDGSNFKRLVKQISDASYFEPNDRSEASPLIRRLLCADPTNRANILDICSDPWVNGAIQQQQQQQLGSPSAGSCHNSLLKVAQDMANLTPVRLDMLLALAPSSSAVVAHDLSARPPLGPKQQQQRQPAEGRKSPLMDPAALMEVATESEVRGSSPVASYVVRDLEMDATAETTVPNASDADYNRDEAAELSVLQLDQQVEVETAAVGEPMQVNPAESDAKMDPTDRMTISTSDAEMKADEDQLGDEVKMDVDAQLVSSQPHSIGGERANEAEEVIEPQVVQPLEQSTDRLTQSEAPEKSENLPGQPIETATQNAAAECEEKQGSSEKETPETAAAAAAPEAGAPPTEDKPKKVKKKIVVVKKKKRISKREAAAESEKVESSAARDKEGKSGKESSGEPEESLNEVGGSKTGNDNSRRQSDASKAKVSVPGKVRIPDSFQEPTRSMSPEGLPKSQESRRQSALIADVSQKLLQQLEQAANGCSQALNKLEQQQLANVRVADKMNEFERRASLASPQPLISPSSKGGSQQEVGAAAAAEEIPNRADSLQELVVTTQLEPTIVEPAIDGRAEAREASKLLAQQPLTEEPKTPTGERMDQDPKTVQSEVGSKQSLEVDLKPNEPRSDSAETIRAEELPKARGESVRSSLKIDLRAPSSGFGEQQEVVRATPAPTATPQTGQTQLVALGPAPIARSYKKVTFTRDGACITETGKIFSTQADDGTVRRIQRKSKVTHFPVSTDSEPSSTSGQNVREEEEEEIVYGDVWAPQGSQTQKRRPFERLIMPSSNFLLGEEIREMSHKVEDQDDDFMRPFSRHHQLGRADSASSCSSGSTDVLDDIFDTWTGAISMFNRPRGGNLMDLHGSMFGSRKLRGGSRRSNAAGSSLTGTPTRCESVEPSQGHGWRASPVFSDRHSGYESDAAPQEMRPTSALSSARGLFGSSSLFEGSATADPFRKLDEFASGATASSLFRDLELEHENMRRRLAQQHKQLWKGSTPSLFDRKESKSSQHRSNYQQQQPPQWQYYRPHEEELLHERPSSSSGSQSAIHHHHHHHQQQQQQSAWPRQQEVHESQSNSSFLRKSVALDAAPNRQPAPAAGEQLPPRQSFAGGQPMRRSISKSSLITSQMSNLQLGPTATGQHHRAAESRHQSASFIELKRTSSTASAQREQQQQQESFVTASRIVSRSGSSSTFWDLGARQQQQETPMEELKQQHQQQHHQQHQQVSADSRIHDWLQESSGTNLSSSSGFKSSASQQSVRSDPVSSLYGSLRPKRENVLARQAQQQSAASFLPPASPSRATEASSRHSSMVVSSLSTGSDLGREERHQEVVRQQQLEQVSTSSGEQLFKTSGNSSKFSSKATFTLREPKSPMGEIERKQQVFEEEQEEEEHVARESINICQPMPQVRASNIGSSTAPIERHAGSQSGLQWIANTSESSSRIFGEEFEADSLSGAGSADGLESHSSSSLLQQLRSRGYRSMINQRMVSNQQDPQQQQQLTSTSSATSMVESSSRVVTSSSSRIVSQKVFTSESSSAANHHIEESSTSMSAIRSQSQTKVLNLKNGPEKVDEQQQDQEERRAGSGEGAPEAAAPLQSMAPETKRTEEDAKEGEDKIDVDEDVREAKANIKAYLDRMRETEMFLKSIKSNEEEEDNMERQRRQLLLFNNMLLSSKLNGIRKAPISSIDEPITRSAPIAEHIDSTSGLYSTRIASTPNGLIPSAALSFEPSYTIPSSAGYQQQQLYHFRPSATPNHYSSTMLDPLEPVEPIPVTYYGRSRSQLGSSELLSSSIGGPYSSMSAAINSVEQVPAKNPYFSPTVRAKRSLSQIRCPPTSSRMFQQPNVSEYRSAYCTTTSSAFGARTKHGLDNDVGSTHAGIGFGSGSDYLNNNEDENDEDDDMSAYRASAYVPKVVPVGSYSPPARIGRGFARRRFQEPEKDEELRKSSRIRRISLQSLPVECEESSPTKRRLSLSSNGNSGEPKTDLTAKLSGSRLSELEQRIQENKRRREELLADRLLPQPTVAAKAQVRSRQRTQQKPDQRLRDVESDEEATAGFNQESRKSSPNSTSSGRLVRPSRLESMEARIKRKSYCVRVGECSPERGSNRQSLERWKRQSQSQSGSRGSISALPESDGGYDWLTSAGGAGGKEIS